jgi:DNA-binding LytR/AlgR family response regulator
MHVEFQQDPRADDLHAILIGPEKSPEVDDLIRHLEGLTFHSMIEARLSGKSAFLKVSDILAFRSHDKKVFARYGGYDWTVSETLSALESKLSASSFIRISNSGIINLHHLRRFDLSNSGIYLAVLSDATRIKVTATYLKAIKERLIAS